MTIQLKTGDIIDFDLLPKPKFKLKDVIWTASLFSNVSSLVVTEIDFDIKYFDNGYTSRFEYTIKYNHDLSEEDIYTTEKDAIAALEKIKAEHKAARINSIKEQLTQSIHWCEYYTKQLEQLNNF